MADPILPGFHPDPSIVLVDGVYYLVTSTFEYLPGLPIHRSTDLRNWELIGNVIVRPEQLDLHEVPSVGGVWAPTIRYRDGLFHLIVSVMFGPNPPCLLFTAADPAGPWSDGLPLPEVDGIDPDLAWDEDGVAYVTYAQFGRGIRQLRVDLETGRALEPARAMWSGTGLHAPEGPHLYRRDDDWYLLIAEGGTERGHAVSVARGPSPSGPFRGDPGNPILSARSTDSPVQNVGHADLVEAPDGGTAMVMLGVRPLGFTRAYSPLGRETFLTRVEWVDGWPRATLPEPSAGDPDAGPPVQEFDLTSPSALDDPEWIAVRRHPVEVATTGPDGLTLMADDGGLSSRRPAFLGRRQTRHSGSVSVRVDVSSRSIPSPGCCPRA